jgi:uncharacterized protein (TIGR03382 family)
LLTPPRPGGSFVVHRITLAFAALSLAACGKPIDSTVVDGSIGNVDFPRAHAIYGKETSGLFAGRVFVLISDSSTACDQLAYDGLFQRSGVATAGYEQKRIPSLYLSITDPAASWSNEATLNNGLQANLDPGGEPVAFGGKVPLQYPSGGALLLEEWNDPSKSNARASGAFNLAFSNGAVSGTFVAEPCETLSPGCSSSGAGLAVPALLALSAALRRRPSSSSSGRAS